MEGEDRNKFDVVVDGTSLVNSILAAALCRAGKSVLHMDKNDFYGQELGTHDLKTFLEVTGGTGDEGVEKHKEESRRYALDVAPKLLYGKGPLVELLVQSDVAKYLEFKALQADFLQMGPLAEAMRVPCSKADVFQNNNISLVEKRFLMKFLTLVQQDQGQEQEQEGGQEKKEISSSSSSSFVDLLKEHKLGPLLEAVMLYAICGAHSAAYAASLSSEEGLRRMRLYLFSLGRFGPTPFLYPLYGCSETAQAFARLAAVHGATYILRRSLAAVTAQPEGQEQLLEDSCGEKWKVHWAVSGGAPLVAENAVPVVYRAVVGLSGHPHFGEGVSLARCTHVFDSGVGFSLHLDSSLKVCPAGKFLVHIWSTSEQTVREILETLGGTKDWTVLYAVDANKGSGDQEARAGTFANANKDFVVETHFGGGLDVDYGDSIAEAMQVFRKICGENAVFLPKTEETEETEE